MLVAKCLSISSSTLWAAGPNLTAAIPSSPPPSATASATSAALAIFDLGLPAFPAPWRLIFPAQAPASCRAPGKMPGQTPSPSPKRPRAPHRPRRRPPGQLDLRKVAQGFIPQVRDARQGEGAHKMAFEGFEVVFDTNRIQKSNNAHNFC